MKPKSNAGAKGKYDKETAEQLIEVVRAGNYISVACGAVGIAKSTLYEWIKTKPEFSNAIKKARHEAQARNVAIIAKAATKQWQAAAWYLERKHPEKWAHKQKIEHSGSIANPITDLVKKFHQDDE